MNRRHLLKSLVAGTLASALPGSLLFSPATLAATSRPLEKRYIWKNWSGNQQCLPTNRFAPQNLEQLRDIIDHSEGSIRLVGSGHSFSSLVPTDDTLISLRHFSGLKAIDNEQQTATFLGGTRLSETGPLLLDHQQALYNMPDVDHQSLAGAIATATHGTGRNLQSLSGYIDGLTLLTASGDLVECSRTKNTELFAAAQVSLGTLGVVTEVRMQNTQAYKLKREAMWLSLEEVLASAESLSQENRHFEFFYIPFTGMCLVDTLNISNEAIHLTQELDGNSGVMDLKTARDYLSWSPKVRELIVGSYLKSQRNYSNVDHAHAIYANDRNVRFNEMEYHLPLENGLLALKEVITTLEKHFPEVFFPLECRYIKADDAWLSPFYKRDSISIAVHRYFEEEYQAFFKAIEPILQKHQGRPHWGKINSFNFRQCQQAYPKWQDFLALRESYDPGGKFLNPYLKQLFNSTHER